MSSKSKNKINKSTTKSTVESKSTTKSNVESTAKQINKSTTKPPMLNPSLTREKTFESVSSTSELTDNTYKILNSKAKIHVFNPTEVHTELEKVIYIVPASERRTSEFMSKFEYTRVISERAQQIQNGSQIFVEPDPFMDEIEIAKLEVKLHKCPFIIRRLYPNGNVGEDWSVNEMSYDP